MSAPHALSPAALRRAPTPAALAALCTALLPGGRVGTVRRLRGGVSSGTHAVEIVGPRGERRRVVVRRYGDWRLRADPRVAEREWAILGALARAGAPTPRPLWLDRTGAVFGCPTIVLSRVPGRGLLVPRDPASWSRQLAEALAQIHRVPLTDAEQALLIDQQVGLHSLLDREAPPPGLAAQAGGGAVWQALRAWWPRLAPTPPALLHGDYWPGNTLWRYGRLTGVVDWEQARRGSPGQDVGCCRLDLTLLAGPAAAEAFTAAYAAASGQPIQRLFFWDLYAAAWALESLDEWVTGYHDLGRTDLPLAEARARLARFVADVLERAARAPS